MLLPTGKDASQLDMPAIVHNCQLLVFYQLDYDGFNGRSLSPGSLLLIFLSFLQGDI
jgi:hypothetical protein